MNKEIFTIGHSTRKIEELVSILKKYNIQNLADVRHFPRSRHNPQFNRENLEKILPKNGIKYFWIESLGGFRNGGYKKYTQTKDFKKGLQGLIRISKNNKTAIICAELHWFRCHRRYIADFFKRKGFFVKHIFDEKKLEKHMITRKRKIKCD